MNVTKTFIFFAMGFLAVALLSANLVSATLAFTSSPGDLMLKQNSTTTTLATTDVGDTSISSLTFMPTQITATGGVSLTLAADPTSFVFNPAASKEIKVSIQSVTGSFPFGRYSTTLTATGTNATGQTVNASIPVYFVQSFCKAGSVGGNLSLDRVDVSSSGDDDKDWRLLDTIDVEVKVKNIGSNDIDNVQVELAIFDESGQNRVGDLDFTSKDDEQVDIGNLNDGDKETHTFQFKVPADFDTGNYKLAVKVYSDDEGEANECDDSSNDLSDALFEQITVDNENDDEKMIVVDDIRLPSQATCGETVSGTFKVYNIGDSDQDQVLITMKNTELGLNKEFVIRQNLDKGDDDTIDFAFDIPATARDGTYSLSFKTFYDYDDNDDSYDQESQDDFTSTFTVLGCRVVPA